MGMLKYALEVAAKYYVLATLKEYRIANGIFNFDGKTIIPRRKGVYAAPYFFCQWVAIDETLMENYEPVEGEKNVFRPKNLAPGEKEEGFEPDSALIVFGDIGYEFVHDWKNPTYKEFMEWFKAMKRYLKEKQSRKKA